MSSNKSMSALHILAPIVLAAACSQGFAIGLGQIQVQSALGQPLRASVSLFGAESSNVTDLCAKGKVQNIDGGQIARLQFGFANEAHPSALVITTSQTINEPVVGISIDVGCGTSVRRNYQILLDPASTSAVPVVQAAAPVVIPARPAQTSVASAPAATPTPASDTSNEKVRHESKNEAKAHRHAEHRSRHAKVARNEQNAAGFSRAEEKKPEPVTHHRHGKKVSRSVLRLSEDVLPAYSSNMPSGLKLSDTLTVEGLDSDPQKAAELRAAQMRFAIIARGEDPEENAKNETKAAQEKIQALLQEAERIKQQREQERAAFEAEQAKSLGINWFIGLCAVFAVALVALVWLARRLHQVNKRNERPFWDHYYSDDDTDTENNTEHDASPFVDTSAQFDDTMSLDEGESVAAFADTDYGVNEEDVKKHSAASSKDAAPTGANLKASEKSAGSSAEIVPLPKPAMAMRSRKRAEMIEVEEISDAMEEAEFWISLRDPQRAISVLEQFNDVERPKSPMAWLYLLKLYREVGERSKFDSLQQRFKSHFNTKAPEWTAKPDEASTKGLEDYPHLLEQICALWGSDRVARFLEDLMFNNRSGQREGFDLPVYLDLIMLANIAYEVFPPNRNGKAATVSRI